LTGVILDSPTVILDSPTVILDSPTVILDSPPLILDSPTVILDSPTVILDSPTVILDSPPLILDSPTVILDSPTVILDSPTVILDSPTVLRRLLCVFAPLRQNSTTRLYHRPISKLRTDEALVPRVRMRMPQLLGRIAAPPLSPQSCAARAQRTSEGRLSPRR